MSTSVSGKQINLGDSLTTHAEQFLSKIIEKYYGKNAESSVIIMKDAGIYKTEISVHLKKGVVLHSDDEDDDPYFSFDNAARKMATQLKKYKEMLRSRKNKVSEFSFEYKFSNQNNADFYGNTANEPVLIADVTDILDVMTVADAQDNLINSSDAIKIFKNKNTNKVNVIYWRKDGNIGWVDVE